ncbi:DUF305 domain-containing protein [Nonomuraea sp. M3C6]|uniref:DUF305 domain-containing protein n=1 Tax=Nonomuraea marmarensis TaxID=3351344 RepID=A0ABW7ANJ3_9ACTN
MNRSALAGIVAGSVLATTAVMGIAVAADRDSPPRQATAQRPTASPTSWGTMEPNGPMCGVSVSDEADYLAQMVAHHQEAVQAAKQLQRSARTEMRTLGASIVTTQSAEIATMNKWLATWYPGRSRATDYQPMMPDLSKLSGDALDKTFLQDMIPHHMMAVMMSQQLLMHGRIQHPEIATFATKVRDAQHAEMLQMQQYLANWFGGGGGMGMPCPM